MAWSFSADFVHVLQSCFYLWAVFLQSSRAVLASVAERVPAVLWTEQIVYACDGLLYFRRSSIQIAEQFLKPPGSGH